MNKRFVALSACMMMLVAPAMAADAITIGVDSRPDAINVAESPGFDWSGFYVGIYGAGVVDRSGDIQPGLGIAAGVNAQLDVILVGAEVALQASTAEPLETTYGQVVGRAGLVLTDEVVIYASAGYGFELDGTGEDLLAGGGVEMAITDSLSLRAEYLRGFASDGLEDRSQFTFGANIHF